MSELVWKRPGRCDSGSCVEVSQFWSDPSRPDDYSVLVRDSTNPDGPVLTFTPKEWRTELDAICSDGLPNGLSLLLPDGDMLWQHDGSSVKFTRDEVAAFIDGALDGEFDHG